MRENVTGIARPRIIVSTEDHERLSLLADAIADRQPDVAEELAREMDRAEIVDPGEVPANVVRMGSTAEFRMDDGQQRRVTLVYPVDADISAGRVSILTPIGAALIGLSEGQSFEWTNRDGRKQGLTVLSCGTVEVPMTP